MNQLLVPTKYGRVKLHMEFLFGSRISVLVKGATFVDKGMKVVYPRGTILMPRRSDAGRSYAFYDTIYAAIRSREHALAGYSDRFQGEKAVLKRASRSVTGISEALLNTGELTSWRLQNVARRIKRLTSSFAGARDEGKREVLERLRKSAGVRDVLERVNPIATGNRLWPAKRLIAERLMEIERIAPHVGIQLVVLELELDRSLAVCRRAVMALDVLLKSPLFTRRAASQKQGVLNRITHLQKELTVLRVEPFSELSFALQLELDAAHTCLAAGDLKPSALMLSDIRRTLAREIARARLEAAVKDVQAAGKEIADFARQALQR